MVDKTEAEFSSITNAISGDIYIGSGETQAIRRIMEIAKQLQDEFPGIRYHIHSGNATDVSDRLDKGLLDFGILIQPADISKYDFLNLPEKDLWGVIMRKDSPLAEKEFIEKEDLIGLPLICSRQVVSPIPSDNEMCIRDRKKCDRYIKAVPPLVR